MKNIRIFILFAVLFCLFPNFANAQQPVNREEDAVIIAEGTGATKDVAATVALRNAIAEVYGVFISSNTVMLNDELIKDEIVSITNGNIRMYEIISEEYINGQCHVVVKAAITVQKLISFCKQKGISEVAIDGASFLMNKKLKEINEQNEIKRQEIQSEVNKKMLLDAFDYSIKISEPQSLDLGGYRVKVIVSIHKNRYWDTIVKTENPNWYQQMKSEFCIHGDDMYYALSRGIKLSDNLGNEYGFSLIILTKELDRGTPYYIGNEARDWEKVGYCGPPLGPKIDFYYYLVSSNKRAQIYIPELRSRRLLECRNLCRKSCGPTEIEFHILYSEDELGKLTGIKLVENRNE